MSTNGDSRVDSKRDSALGKHSADFGGLEATADHQSSSAPKPPKNYESPTAIPRILEEESRAEQQSSLRADSGGEAIHNQKTQKMDSRGNAPSPSLRALHRKAWQSNSAPAESKINGARKACNLEKTLSQAKLESSNNAQKVESSMDCHADKSARNDSKNATSEKVDSRGNALSPSLRDFALAKSWQSTSSKNAKAQNADSRNFTQATQSVETLKNGGAESAFDTKVAGGRILR